MAGDKKYSSFDDIARAANHLEHFHSYRRGQAQDINDDASEGLLSIDMHADQGLFIAFVPALLVEDEAAPNSGARVVEGASVGQFYLKHRDGTVAEVDFGDGDELVFMLGDGVEQYFNDKYDGPNLRAAPHAMVMPQHAPQQSRAWYGRMFLPPDEALNERHGLSYARFEHSAPPYVCVSGCRVTIL